MADTTFSAEDIIRIYQRNLTPEEQEQVRAFFQSNVFGGTGYIARTIQRIVFKVAERVGRTIDDQFGLDEVERAFIADLVERTVEQSPRFQRGARM